MLYARPEIVVAYPSSSGYGVHALAAGPVVKTKAEHKSAWLQLIPKFVEGLNLLDIIKLDYAGKDVNRRLFIPYIDEEYRKVKSDPKPFEMPVINDRSFVYSSTAPFKFTADEVSTILDSLPTDYREDYSQWIKVICMVKAELEDTDVARRVLVNWSKGSPKYNSDKDFYGEKSTFNGLDPYKDGGINGASLTYLAKKHCPNVVLAARHRSLADFKPEYTEYGCAPLGDDIFAEVSDLVPEIGEIRKQAIDDGISPTAAVFAVLTTVSQYAGWGVRVEGYNSHPDQPISSNLVVLAPSGKGKSAAMTWAIARYDREDLWQYAAVATNVTSGQAFVSAYLRQTKLSDSGRSKLKEWQEANEDKKQHERSEKPLMDEDKDYIVTKPNMIVTFDEVSNFDQVTAGSKHGDGLMGTVNASTYGVAAHINQVAATDVANRHIPISTPIQIGTWINCQPGLGSALLDKVNGFTNRFLVISPSPTEHFKIPEIGVENKPRKPNNPFDNWKPPALEAEYGISMVRLNPEVHEFLSNVDELRKISDSSSEAHAVDRKILEERIGDDRWGKMENPHILPFVVRLASAMALYAGDSKVERCHLDAALPLAIYSNDSKEAYRKYLSTKTVTGKVGEKLIEAHVDDIVSNKRHEAALVGCAQKMGEWMHKQDGEANAGDLWSDGVPSRWRKQARNAEIKAEEVRDFAESQGWITKSGTGYKKGATAP